MGCDLRVCKYVRVCTWLDIMIAMLFVCKHSWLRLAGMQVYAGMHVALYITNAMLCLAVTT